MKNLKEWNEDLERTKHDIYSWALGMKHTWKAHAIFLGVFVVLFVCSLLVKFYLISRIFGLILIFQIGRIVIHWIKDKWNERKERREKE